MKVFLFGLGAIGSNLFISMLKQFPEWNYVGVDFDKVEQRNLKTQVYLKDHINNPKTMALMSLGCRYVQKLKYTHVITRITKDTKLADKLESKPGDLWLDCFDNSESRKALKQIVPQGVHLLHLGFSPLYSAECIWDEGYEVPGNVDPNLPDICSMDDAVGFIQHFVGLSLMNLNDWVKTEKKRSFIITNKYKLSWL